MQARILELVRPSILVAKRAFCNIWLVFANIAFLECITSHRSPTESVTLWTLNVQTTQTCTTISTAAIHLWILLVRTIVGFAGFTMSIVWIWRIRATVCSRNAHCAVTRPIANWIPCSTVIEANARWCGLYRDKSYWFRIGFTNGIVQKCFLQICFIKQWMTDFQAGVLWMCI